MNNKNNYNNRLFQILNNESFSSEFISGIAGDQVQTTAEKDLFEKLLKESGGDFYVKLLFHITHEVFENEEAYALWNEILAHKIKLSKVLKRNVEITVASLDYLTNIKNEFPNPKIIGEAFIGKIAEIASVDPLTKLYIRQHLSQFLKKELLRYNRYKIAFSILLIDIDNFKNVNDSYGHQAGDYLLVTITEVLTQELRDLDMCARYGGDEFIIILPHTSERKAFEIAERVRNKVGIKSPEMYGVTLSIGVACCPYNASAIDCLIKSADEALYKSKTTGRNQSILSQQKF